MKDRRTAVILVVLQTFQALTLLPWLGVAGFALMAFDAPGSANSWQPWAFVALVWSYPLWIIGGVIVSWILYKKEKRRGALGLAIFLSLPVPIVLLLLLR